jgi:ATP-dependent Clp protease protease subunit
MKNRIFQLLRDNAAKPRNFRVENAATDEATIFIYDVIGMDFWTGDGVTAQAFANALAGITAPTIHLRINSPGGDVFEARAMVAQMRNHAAKFIGHVDGLAASAASTIAVCCDELDMADGSMLMVHNAWTLVIGNKEDMTSTAALLAKIDGTIAADYAQRSGATLDQAQQWMASETWFTAQEAVAANLADSVATGSSKASAKNAAQWNLTAYEHAPALPEPEATPSIDEADLRARNERRLGLIERTA